MANNEDGAAVGRLDRFLTVIFGCALVLPAIPAEAKNRAPEPPPPPPPAPVAPRVVTIPPRPYPPLGAPPTLVVPPLGPDGVRLTVNAHLTPNQALWNLRSAYNVAALDCRRPAHAEILDGYRAFLKTHALALAASNRQVDAEFKARHGAGFARSREAYATQVYNYFANPSTLSGFCDAALEMSRAAQQVPSGQLASFSQAALPKLEAVFEAFFRAYEQYRIDVANWDARFGRFRTVLPGEAGR